MTENTRSGADEWSAVAPAWDASADYVDSHSVAATDALVASLALQPGHRALELGAGPGTLGATWSALVGPSGAVTLSDIAPGMVEAAWRRNAGLANVEVAVLDAEAIDRPAGSFDAVAGRMSLMFAADPRRAFAEISRVLVPGGRLGALTWAGPEHNPWLTCVGMAAMVNGVLSGGPPVGPGGIFSLGDPAGLAALAKEAGFVNVAVEEVPVTFSSTGIDEHISRVSSLAGHMAAAFAAATEEQLAAVRRTAADLAAPHQTDAGLRLPGRALLLTART